jgi:hypothetical protein
VGAQSLIDLLLAMVSDGGRQILLYERTLTQTYVEDQITMCELCLGLEEWMKKTSYKSTECRSANLHGAITFVLGYVEQTLVRGGMGSLLIKNHLYLHLRDYMKMWGPLRQMNSGPSESHHKTKVKAPSMNTQRRAGSFIQQTSQRYTELRVMRKACQRMGISDAQVAANTPPTNLSGLHVTGARYSLGYVNGVPSMRWDSKSHLNRGSILPAVIDLVCQVILPLIPGDTVPCFTEHKRLSFGGSDTTTHIFRAHPCYRAKESHPKDVWYDWAKFDCGPGRLVPGQIVCLMDLLHMPAKTSYNYRGYTISGPGQYAVIRKFKAAEDYFRMKQMGEVDGEEMNLPYSDLVRWGELDDGFYILDCESIGAVACVVPNLPCIPWAEARGDKKRTAKEKALEAMVDPLGGYFVVKNKQNWAEWFTSSVVLQQTHRL